MAERTERFVMEISCTLTKLNEGGNYTNERMSFHETVTLEVDTFLEMAGILGTFHKLADVVKADKGAKR